MKLQFAKALDMPATPLLLRVAKVRWEHLPLILGVDLVLSVAVLPLVLVWLMGLPLLAPWMAVLTLGPLWTATSAETNRLLSGETVSCYTFLRAMRNHWRAALRLSVVPALVATLFIGTWNMLAAYPHMGWLFLPLIVDGCVAVLVGLASLSAFSLVTTRSLSGWRLWQVSLALTTLCLGKMLGILALFLLSGVLLLLFNAGLLPLLFAPLAVCLAALTRQTCAALASQNQEKRV